MGQWLRKNRDQETLTYSLGVKKKKSGGVLVLIQECNMEKESDRWERSCKGQDNKLIIEEKTQREKSDVLMVSDLE